jgi:hypothetical protein
MSTPGRTFKEAYEPLVSAVYFAPEAQELYRAAGLSFLSGYFCSRGAPLGRAPGEVIAASFGAFNPKIVIPSVTEGWSKISPEEILALREKGAIKNLENSLGDISKESKKYTLVLIDAASSLPDSGRPLFAGLRALKVPDDPTGALWRALDVIREYRGDTHTLVWNVYGLTSVEITLLTEAFLKLKPRSYIYTRGWSSDDVDHAFETLRAKGSQQFIMLSTILISSEPS